jgi:hypothetical protein
MSNWLKQFTRRAMDVLIQINSELLYEQIDKRKLRRLTIDVDGTVVQAGKKVAGAARGFNPHRKKNKSYYPLTAHLAQTGQIIRVRNRPGNVHDSRGSDAFLRELIAELRERFGRSRTVEFRMDSAFFRREIIRRFNRERLEYAIKAGFWPWLGLRSAVAKRRRWYRINDEVSGFAVNYHIEPWELTVRMVIFRKRIRHRSPRNYQLDLFDPNDGYFEYSAVATSKSLSIKNVWAFISGRGGHEKTLSELKGQFAFDVVPTNDYRANSTWQQLSVLSHNLARGFQLDTLEATKPQNAKRTCRYLIRSMRTIRFLLICKAGRLTRTNGRSRLRIPDNAATRSLYENIESAIAA